MPKSQKAVENINKSLLPLAIPLDSLKLNPKNDRGHADRSIESIMDSYRQAGQQKPIVVTSDGVVAAGNGQVQAAKKLGWTKIAAVVYDGEIPWEAFGIIDNRSAELSHWDFRQLAGNLKDLRGRDVDITKLGWADYELQPLLAASWSPPDKKDGGLDDEKKTELRKLEVTSDQWVIIEGALELCRQQCDFPDMTNGRAIELICADYISGNTQTKEKNHGKKEK